MDSGFPVSETVDLLNVARRKIKECWWTLLPVLWVWFSLLWGHWDSVPGQVVLYWPCLQVSRGGSASESESSWLPNWAMPMGCRKIWSTLQFNLTWKPLVVPRFEWCKLNELLCILATMTALFQITLNLAGIGESSVKVNTHTHTIAAMNAQ